MPSLLTVQEEKGIAERIHMVAEVGGTVREAATGLRMWVDHETRSRWTVAIIHDSYLGERGGRVITVWIWGLAGCKLKADLTISAVRVSQNIKHLAVGSHVWV